MAVFYSFHYERDVNRVQLIRNMGKIDGQEILRAQQWESIQRRGDSAIKDWISAQMKGKTAVVVLIGQETASRRWVQHQIKEAWHNRKPLLGIRIHGLSAMGQTDSEGPDPFTIIPDHTSTRPLIPIFDPTVRDWDGINSQATYRYLASNLYAWSQKGFTRS